MKKNISLYKLLCVISYSVFLVFILSQSDLILSYNYSLWLVKVNSLFIMMFIIQMVFSKIMFKKILNLSTILLICTYIFNLSFPFLQNFSSKYSFEIAYKLRNFDTELVKQMVTYPIKYIAVLFFGMIIFDTFMMKNNKPLDKTNELSIKKSNSKQRIIDSRLANLLFAISFPIDLVILIIRLIAFIRGGYVEAYSTAIFFKYYSSFFSYLLFCSVFLKWSTSHNSNQKQLYYVLYCIYQVIWMFTGQRAISLILIILASWLYFGFEKKVNIKSIPKYIFIGYLGIVLLNFISEYRIVGFNNITFNNIFTKNAIFDALSEFGITLNIFGYVLQFTGNHNIGYGFVYMLIFIFPKVSWLGINTFNYDIYTALNLSASGSSYLAEILFDFKQYGIYIIFLYGFFVRWLDIKISYLVINKQFHKVIYYFPLAIMIVFCVRTGTVNILRTFIWTGILITVVEQIIYPIVYDNTNFIRRI